MKIGVALLNFGGPQRPEELVPFLTELLTDVLPGPMFVKRRVAPLIARSRSKVVGPNYEEIGWSPLVDIHHQQLAALRAQLPDDLIVASGMMFTPPTMDHCVQDLLDQGVDTVIAISMFPHYSIATTQTAYSFFHEALTRAGKPDLPVHWVPAYFDHPDYISALGDTILEGAESLEGSGPIDLLFTPHGLPLSFVRRGDPYPSQIRESVRRVIAHLQWTDPWHLGWQSRLGPVKWLSPSTPDMLEALAEKGRDRVLLVPISFVCDHIETLHEIDIEYRDLARELNIAHFGRAPSLGLNPAFIRCLAERIGDARRHMSRYRCVRCLLPKDDTHRRRRRCEACHFDTPAYLSQSRYPSGP